MAATIDERMAVAGVYAEALFELAWEASRVEDVRAELEELVRLAEVDPEFAEFLATVALDVDQQIASLERIFRNQLSDMVLNTLLAMVRHRRGGLLRALLRSYVLALEEAAGQIEARATSAVALTDAQRAAVTQLAAEKSGKKPLMDFVVESELLGGLILQIGDWRYDNSLRRQLHDMKLQLSDRGDRGLEVGVRD